MRVNPKDVKEIVGHDAWAAHPIEEWDLVREDMPFHPRTYFYRWVQKLPKCSCGKEVVPGSDLCEECNGSAMS